MYYRIAESIKDFVKTADFDDIVRITGVRNDIADVIHAYMGSNPDMGRVGRWFTSARYAGCVLDSWDAIKTEVLMDRESYRCVYNESGLYWDNEDNEGISDIEINIHGLISLINHYGEEHMGGNEQYVTLSEYEDRIKQQRGDNPYNPLFSLLYLLGVAETRALKEVTKKQLKKEKEEKKARKAKKRHLKEVTDQISDNLKTSHERFIEENKDKLEEYEIDFNIGVERKKECNCGRS